MKVKCVVFVVVALLLLTGCFTKWVTVTQVKETRLDNGALRYIAVLEGGMLVVVSRAAYDALKDRLGRSTGTLECSFEKAPAEAVYVWAECRDR